MTYSISGYNERGLAKVLDGAHDLVKRAADLYRGMDSIGPSPIVKSAQKREIDLCLAEAEELIAAVRAERPTIAKGAGHE